MLSLLFPCRGWLSAVVRSKAYSSYFRCESESEREAIWIRGKVEHVTTAGRLGLELTSWADFGPSLLFTIYGVQVASKIMGLLLLLFCRESGWLKGGCFRGANTTCQYWYNPDFFHPWDKSEGTPTDPPFISAAACCIPPSSSLRPQTSLLGHG